MFDPFRSITKPAYYCLMLFSMTLSVNQLNAKDHFYTIELGLSQDSNIGLAIEDKHIKDDTLLDAYFDYGVTKELGASQLLTATATLEHTRYDAYPWLDRTEYGSQLLYQKKIGVGQDVPWVDVGMGLTRRDSKSDIRDAWLFNVDIGVRQSVNERWDWGVALNYLKENADSVSDKPLFDQVAVQEVNYNVFDLENTELSFTTSYAVTYDHYFNLGYRFRTGDIASLGEVGEVIENYASAGVYDPAFGGKEKPAIWSYRIAADSHIFSVGWDYIINERSSIGLSYSHQQTEAMGDMDYARNITRLKYTYGK